MGILSSGCHAGSTEPKVTVFRDVPPDAVRKIKDDMAQLIDSTSQLQHPNFIAARATDEYRQQLAQVSGGDSDVPCAAVDFAAFLKGPMVSVKNLNDWVGPLQLSHAPSEITAYPAYFVANSRNATIDRWYRQPSPNDELTVGADMDGDINADEIVSVASGNANNLIPAKDRLISSIQYHISYRQSDLKITGFAIEKSWYFFSVVPGLANVAQLVPEAKPQKSWATFEKTIEGYIVCDYRRPEWALIANSRFPGIASTENSTPDLETQAATITRVAIPYEEVAWHNISTTPPFTATVGQTPEGIYFRLNPIYHFAGGSSSAIPGYDSFNLAQVVIPVSPEVMAKWRAAGQDTRLPSNSGLRIYLLATITGQRIAPNYLAIAPEKVVATAWCQYAYQDDALASHPDVILETPETIIGECDVSAAVADAVARNSSRIQHLHQKQPNLWPGR